MAEMFGDVAGLHTGVVHALDSTTESADRDLGIAAGSNRGKEALIADGAGNHVVFRLVPETTGHSATAAVDFRSSVARRDIQQLQCIVRSD